MKKASIKIIAITRKTINTYFEDRVIGSKPVLSGNFSNSAKEIIIILRTIKKGIIK
jgi:hypothetical protein